jgi:hypothetical protein
MLEVNFEAIFEANSKKAIILNPRRSMSCQFDDKWILLPNQPNLVIINIHFPLPEMRSLSEAMESAISFIQGKSSALIYLDSVSVLLKRTIKATKPYSLRQQLTSFLRKIINKSKDSCLRYIEIKVKHFIR